METLERRTCSINTLRERRSTMDGKTSFSPALMENKTSVLIVDKDVNLCRTLSFIVRRNGQDVTVAKDGGGGY